MTTRDFIQKNYGVTATRDRFCSSVFADRDGNVYSYGYHYPLAFQVAGLDFVNVQGYSSTTAKHIAWAKGALNYDYVPVKLWRDEAYIIANSYQSQGDKLDAIRKAVIREVNRVQVEMAKKKRKNTQVYASLQAELSTAMLALEQIEEVL